jgi:hypothetical protein
MKAVLRTTDRALIETLRVALESEGIAVALDPEAAGTALPFLTVTVLVSDSDYERAVEVVRELAPEPLVVTSARPRSRRLWQGLLLALILLALIVCGTLLVG